MRNKFFRIAFGLSGDQTAIPDGTQSTGAVSFNQGWGPDYQRDQSTDPLAKDIDRATFNYLMYAATSNLQQYQTEGIPEWISAADNNAISYAYDAGIVVRYRPDTSTPFTEWVSLVTGNTATPGTDATKWQPFIYQEATDSDATAGTSGTVLMTPRRVATAVAALATSAPVGSVISHAATAVPANYLECNGALVSRTTYAALFAVIGTTWGAGDGTTTFALPDFRGEFLRGFDNGRNIDPSRIFASLQLDQMQNHQHANYTNSTKQYQGGSTVGDFLASTQSDTAVNGIGAPTTLGSNGTPRVGTETRPRNRAVLFVIKYK